MTTRAGLCLFNAKYYERFLRHVLPDHHVRATKPLTGTVVVDGIELECAPGDIAAIVEGPTMPEWSDRSVAPAVVDEWHLPVKSRVTFLYGDPRESRDGRA